MIIVLGVRYCRESVEGHYVPNAGFLEDVVFADPASSFSQTSHSSNDAMDSSHNQPSETSDKEVEDSVDPVPDNAAVSQSEARNDTAEGITSSVADLKVTDDASVEESIVEDQQPFSAEDVDMLLDRCLLQALHTTIKDKDLPMPGSTLW